MELATPEKKHLSRLFIAPALLGALALGGCSAEGTALISGDVLHMTPVDRFGYDYFGGNTSQCLTDTAFTTDQATFSYDKQSDTLTATAKNGKELSLEGFDQAKTTVKPADQASQDIFNSYGCVVSAEQ